jgi:hypothetical protein
VLTRDLPFTYVVWFARGFSFRASLVELRSPICSWFSMGADSPDSSRESESVCKIIWLQNWFLCVDYL